MRLFLNPLSLKDILIRNEKEDPCNQELPIITQTLLPAPQPHGPSNANWAKMEFVDTVFQCQNARP